MIKVVAISKIKDGKLDEVIGIYEKEMLEQTRKEKGNISYDLCKKTDEENIIAMIEEWKDNDVFEAHLKMPHYLSAIPKISVFVEKKEVSVFEKIER